jgi:hypothetical protein
MKIIFFCIQKVTEEKSGPDLLVRGTDPHQNVTDPQHWVQVFYILQFYLSRIAVSLHLCAEPESGSNIFRILLLRI